MPIGPRAFHPIFKLNLAFLLSSCDKFFASVFRARGPTVPELDIVDGAPGLEKAIAALRNNVPNPALHGAKHRNLLAYAPKKPYDEISADYADMIYTKTVKEVNAKRKALLHK